jgi:hypothetical protein
MKITGSATPIFTSSSWKAKPRHSLQAHVEHQAAGCIRALAGEEFVRRGEQPDVETRRGDEVAERIAHRGVVVDDEHDGSVLAHHEPTFPCESVCLSAAIVVRAPSGRFDLPQLSPGIDAPSVELAGHRGRAGIVHLVPAPAR